jgi:hypothetical protein
MSIASSISAARRRKNGHLRARDREYILSIQTTAATSIEDSPADEDGTLDPSRDDSAR